MTSDIAAESDATQLQKLPIKVMLVDDHPLLRDALKMHLNSQPDIKVVAEAKDGEEAIKMVEKSNPDVIIMDIAMPRMNGVEATRQIKTKHPNVAIIVLTIHTDIEYVLKILEAGAAGYLIKDIPGEELAHAIRWVISGESLLSKEMLKKLIKHAIRYPVKSSVPVLGERLTAREMEVLILAARGHSNKEIAQELGINLRTVKGYFVNIFSKLNVSSRTEAIHLGLKEGIIKLADID